MVDMIEKMRATIERYGLIERGDRILIALSGGPDSVSMFHLLNMLAFEYDLELAAIHLNHKLRRQADSDQLFCRELARAHGYKFYSRKADIKKRAQKSKVGIEQAGRDYRYAYFDSVCEKYGYDKIATGHTADDSAETFLLNLIRGADLGGLCGIPPRRGKIIRPLIELSKNQLLEFLDYHHLSYRIDKSNFGIDYNRNVVRNIIFPDMAKINPGVIDHISRSSLKIRKAYEFIESEAEKAYELCLIDKSKRQIILDLRKLSLYYKSLESWVLLRAYFQLAESLTRPGSNLIERALSLSRNGALVFLGDGVVVSYHDKRLILSRPSRQIKRIRLKRNEVNKLSGTGWRIKIEELPVFELEAIKLNSDESIAYLDGELIDELEVRNIRNGDRFKPLGFKGTKKLADYLNDKNVPQINKKSIPIVVCKDKIAWVAGFGISDEFKVSGTSKQVLKLQLIDG